MKFTKGGFLGFVSRQRADGYSITQQTALTVLKHINLNKFQDQPPLLFLHLQTIIQPPLPSG